MADPAAGPPHPDPAHADEQPGRLEGHINAAEYWIMQADHWDFPDPARTECIQLALVHASLAQALRGSGG